MRGYFSWFDVGKSTSSPDLKGGKHMPLVWMLRQEDLHFAGSLSKDWEEGAAFPSSLPAFPHLLAHPRLLWHWRLLL